MPLSEAPQELNFATDVWGEQVRDLAELDGLFSAETFNGLQEDPVHQRELFAAAHGKIEACRVRLLEFLMVETFGQAHPNKHRSPKNPGLDAIKRSHGSIVHVYPDYQDPKKAMIQALYLNMIYFGAVGEFMAHLLGNHPLNKHVQRLQGVFAMARKFAPGIQGERLPSMINEIESIKAFFRTHQLDLSGIANLPTEEIQRINGQMFETAQSKREYDIPCTLAHEKDIFHGPVCLVSDHIDPSNGMFGIREAEFTVYDDSLSYSLLVDRAVLEGARTHTDRSTMNAAKEFPVGKVLALLVERFGGGLGTMSLTSAALRTLMGEREYEVLRAHTLLRYGQLVCDDDTFVREFGKFVTLVSPPQVQGHGTKGTTGGGSHPPAFGPPAGQLPMKFFPRGYRRYLTSPGGNSQNVPTGRRLKGRRTEHHRRLLPVGLEPTKEAWGKAQDDGVDLLHNFEVVYEVIDPNFRFTSANLQQEWARGERIFSYTELEPEARARGISPESLLAFPNTFQERKHTYVVGHQFGNVPDAVRGAYGYRARAAAGMSKAVP